MAADIVRVYVDGFNLYYGALKKTPHRWLDLPALSRRLMPSSTLDRVVYCTARVTPKPHDPNAGRRQNIYLRVLEDSPDVEVLYGQFSVNNTEMPRRHDTRCTCCAQTPPGCWCCRGPMVAVVKTEEKGSDVHLGVRLVADAYEGAFDTALVISGDADLQPAIDIVRNNTKKRVVVVDPRNRKRPVVSGDERRQLRPAALAACQLPTVCQLSTGATVRRPSNWT